MRVGIISAGSGYNFRLRAGFVAIIADLMALTSHAVNDSTYYFGSHVIHTDDIGRYSSCVRDKNGVKNELSELIPD